MHDGFKVLTYGEVYERKAVYGILKIPAVVTSF